MAFGSGSSVIMPLKNEAGMPLNGLEVAQNVAEVLAYDPTVRYIGMAVYCIDEQCLYRFKRTLLDDGTYSDGLQDADFQPEEGNVNVNLVTNDYSTLPTVTKDTIIYCKNDYIDTNVTPNVNYKKGFYLYDDNISAWELIDINAKDKYPLWETSVEYSEEDLITYNGTKYRCVVGHTSGATFEENKDNWIYVLEEYYVLTQVQYDNLVTNGVVTDDTKHLYIVIDVEDEETVITTGTYECKGDILTVQAAGQDGSVKIRTEQIRIEGSELRLINTGTGSTKLVLNRVKKEFSIQNKYNIFNVIPQLVSKDGDDAMLLPEGLTYNGQDRIPTSEMEGKALVESARKYFSEILFNGDGTLSHTFEGETLDKPYTFGNNKLTVTFQPGSKAYDIQADIFPNESEERLFIVIPNQRNWGAVFISLLKRENPGLTITDEQVEAMCDEQESTFETFTLILSYDKVK
ncbi:MAG: hypothetical protein II202_02210 [Bacteroidales bacterium]|nr:hypothetical protein [Bacteroidales bacterium]